MKKKTLFSIMILLIIPIATAFNNPGHDSLYVLKLGDTITGSLNVTQNLTANQLIYEERLYASNLIIKGDGTTSAATNHIYALTNELAISSPELKLNFGVGGTIKAGSISTPTILNVTGQILLNNQNVCLGNGTNCPDLGSGNFEGTLPITSGGTGATTAEDARTNLGAGTMSNWAIEASGTGGTQTINQGNTVTFQAGTGTAITRSGSTITINATGTGGTVTNIATNNGITGGPITTTGTIGLTGQALALHNLASNGIIVRTGTGTVTARAVAQGTGILVTNGDGVSANPTVALNTTYTDGRYVQVTGDTMSGTLNMGNQKITSLQNGTASQDAVTFSQLQAVNTTVTGNYVPYTGATTTVNLGTQNLTTTGRIGIGTASPSRPLHISGSDTGAGGGVRIRVHNTNTAGYGVFEFYKDASTLGGAFFQLGSTATGYGGADSFNMINVPNAPLTLGTNNVVVQTITGAGNVGIGTSNPQQKLHVVGSAVINGTINMDSNKIVNLQNGTASQDAVTKSQLDAAITGTEFDKGSLVQGTGISLSGTLTDRLVGSGSVTVNLNDTGVSLGSYGVATNVQYPVFTVDAQGRITSASTTTIRDASTSQTGIVQLTDSISTTSSILAATATAVKSAYDLADSKVSKSGDTMSGTLNMGNQKITSLQNGTASQDAVTFSQLQAVNTTVTGNYVPYTGATTTVNLGSQNLLTTGSVGIGTASPGGKLEIQQAMSGYATAFTSPHLKLRTSNTVDNTGFVGITYDASTSANYGWSSGAVRTGSGHSNFIWKYHHGNVEGVERMRIDTTGNLGVGTTSPQQLLHVAGNAVINGTINMDSNKIVNLQNGTASQDAVTKSQLDAAITGTEFVKGSLVQGTGISLSGTLSNRLVGSGSVTVNLNDTGVILGSYGVATNVQYPVFTVDAQGRITSASTTTIRDASGSVSGIVSTGTQTFAGAKTFTGVATFSATPLTLSANSAVLSFSSTTGVKQITTGGNTDLALMPGGTGNVGIGTTTPGATLDINGNLRVANNQWISARNAAGTGTINMFKVNANNEIDVGATLNIGSLVFAQDSGLITAMDMPVSSTPSAGTPQGYAFKVDGDNIAVIYSEADGTGGTQNRRVGIGTATPSATLHVTGTFQLQSGTAVNDISTNTNLGTSHDALATQGAIKSYVDSQIASSGTMNSWTLAGDTGSPQTISDEQTATIVGGIGLTTVAGATRQVTINLDNTSVNAGTYGATAGIQYPRITVDAQGRITSASAQTIRSATTSQTGIVQLSSSISSTSNTVAATAGAVKTAYDQAVTANNNADARVLKTGDTMTGGLEFGTGTNLGVAYNSSGDGELVIGDISAFI